MGITQRSAVDGTTAVSDGMTDANWVVSFNGCMRVVLCVSVATQYNCINVRSQADK